MPINNVTYKSAGVDIDAGNQLVHAIKPLVQTTQRKEVLAGLGGFGGLFQLDVSRYKEPILVSGTDGVGTKLKLANTLNQHDTIGIDLVAMCVNDLIVCGAEPLFFLDYYATGQLKQDIATHVIAGIAKGCQQAGAALIGGETAEMPGMYQGEEYDLAGFCVGAVEKSKLITPANVQAGDILLGLASSGPHANGYSLIRHILNTGNIDLNMPFGPSTLGQALMEPTRIYVPAILKLLETVDVHCMAHITGGGLLENVPRVLPDHLSAHINRRSFSLPDIFHWLQQQGDIETEELYRTFNCGIGMVIGIPATQLGEATAILTTAGEKVFQIGTIEACQANNAQQVLWDEA